MSLSQDIFISLHQVTRHPCALEIPKWGFGGHTLSFWEHEASLGFLNLKHSARKFLLVPLRIRDEGLTFPTSLGPKGIQS